MKPKFRKVLPFRAWFYFRMGWSTYFAFIFSAVNTLVVTYYLALENVPILKDIFPSFVSYALTLILIGGPLLILFGWVHYKKSQAFSSEQDITYESSPYFFKYPKGWQREVTAPFQLIVLELMEKIVKNEQLSDEDKKEIGRLRNDLKKLMEGGTVGK
jgi:hypothetical protein